MGVVSSVGNAPLYVGLHNHIFSAHGVSVTVKSYSTTAQEINALKQGDITVAAGPYADFLYAQATGQTANSMQLLADGYDASSNLVEVLTLPSSGITTPQGLTRQTIATPEPGQIPVAGNASTPYSMEMLATESVMASEGVSPSNVTWRPMPMSGMISALHAHTVQAILVTEPYIFEAESQLGATEVIDSCSGVTSGLPLAGYFSLTSFVRGNAPVLRSFQEALLAAQSAASMRGPVTSVLGSSAGVKAQDAALVNIGTYPTFLNVGQVQRVAQLLYESGATSTLINVKSMVFTG